MVELDLVRFGRGDASERLLNERAPSLAVVAPFQRRQSTELVAFRIDIQLVVFRGRFPEVQGDFSSRFADHGFVKSLSLEGFVAFFLATHSQHKRHFAALRVDQSQVGEVETSTRENAAIQEDADPFRPALRGWG